MTAKKIKIDTPDFQKESYKKLSIQCSLNGLSFFVTDTITNQVILSKEKQFQKRTTPYLVLKALRDLFTKHDVLALKPAEVVITHSNHLFSLVPNSLFSKEASSQYLKLNTKLLATDEIAYDELQQLDLVSVYVPFTNINNYLFDLFGSFEFKHVSTVLLETLAKHHQSNKEVCYVHVAHNTLEVVVFRHKKMLFYNQFDYTTAEDFLYYILFVYEQLHLDVETVKLKLFGQVEEGDENFELCYTYIRKVKVFIPKNTFENASSEGTFDLTLLS